MQRLCAFNCEKDEALRTRVVKLSSQSHRLNANLTCRVDRMLQFERQGLVPHHILDRAAVESTWG